MGEAIWLFSYGTLRQANVQRELFGREVVSVEDALTGFEIDSITITDPAVIEKSGSDQHPILRPCQHSREVRGTALLINEADLKAADDYEVEDYVRVPVVLRSGRKAFAYVQRDVTGAAPSLGDVKFAIPSPSMLEKLLPVARRIFKETFSKDYDAAEFEAFCDEIYLPGGSMSRDFTAPDVRWLLATVKERPIGYAKLTPLRAPATGAANGALELQQLYVLSNWHGSGVADRLMEWSLTTAMLSGAPEVYLTVFDHNVRAKRFYARYGFEEVGNCTFQLGTRIDDDRIWRRPLTGPLSEVPCKC